MCLERKHIAELSGSSGGLVKNRWLGPIPRVSDSVDRGLARESALLTGSQVMLMRLVWGLLFVSINSWPGDQQGHGPLRSCKLQHLRPCLGPTDTESEFEQDPRETCVCIRVRDASEFSSFDPHNTPVRHPRGAKSRRGHRQPQSWGRNRLCDICCLSTYTVSLSPWKPPWRPFLPPGNSPRSPNVN